MPKLIIFSILLFSALLTKGQELHVDTTYKSRMVSLALSDGKKRDTLGPWTTTWIEPNQLTIVIWKKIPNPSVDSVRRRVFKGLCFERLPESQEVEFNIVVSNMKVKDFYMVRKAKDRRFKCGYQIKLPITKYQITLSDSVPKKKEWFMGKVSMQLPIELGWMPNDTLAVCSFASKSYEDYVPIRKPEIPASNQLVIDENFVNDQQLSSYPGIVTIDTIKNRCQIVIGRGDGLGGKYFHLNFFKKPFMISQIRSYEYSDVEDDIKLEYSKFHLEMNRNPFDRSKLALCGKFIIATDSLPMMYGDVVVEGNNFTCDSIRYKTIPEE